MHDGRDYADCHSSLKPHSPVFHENLIIIKVCHCVGRWGMWKRSNTLFVEPLRNTLVRSSRCKLFTHSTQ